MAGKVYGKTILVLRQLFLLTYPLFISKSPLVISRYPLFISRSPLFILSYETNALPKMNNDNMNATMKIPFDIRLTQHEIRIVLSRRFNCSISVWQLRHVLARLQLYMYRS